MVLVVIINWTYTRSRTVKDILMTSPDTVFVHITNWEGDTPRNKNTELTEQEFNKVIEMMSSNEYRKAWGVKSYTSNSRSFYFIAFECYISKSNEYQTITLTNEGGFVQINNYRYDVSGGVDKGKEMIHNIYEYIYEILEEE